MAENNYPRVLIFGQPFNNFSGGGITISNLFKGWPKDKLAVASTGHTFYKASTDMCNLYYLLGIKEQHWRFPFNYFQRSFPSGLITFSKKESLDSRSYSISLRKILVDRIFYPFLFWIGLYHCLSEISLSDEFRKWLEDYKPEILYLQVASRADVLFAIQLCEFLNIPTVIHNMDDWPSTISRRGLFKRYWHNKIDREFKQLLSNIDLFLSISDAMSSEYFRRYNKKFLAFHNPIDISRYYQVKKFTMESDRTFRILYIGRIGLANKQSIYKFAKVVSFQNSKDYTVEFDIYTYNHNTRKSKEIDKFKNVRVLPPVKHELIPDLLTEYDLLLLPLDFTDAGFKYSQFSLPTKASEYMISGTPILVFAPKETAISRFCTENECAYCLSDAGKEKISSAIEYLIVNKEFREKISGNAVKLATELFDGERVRHRFQQLLIDLYDN